MSLQLLNVLATMQENSGELKIAVPLLQLLQYLQTIKIVNTIASESTAVYYIPYAIPFETPRLTVDFFYQRISASREGDEKTPGFLIHLLICIKNSAPLHVILSKKAPHMLHIDFRHPITENLELLKGTYAGIKRSLASLGYQSVHITEMIADTRDPDYKSRLFFPRKHIIKSINITG